MNTRRSNVLPLLYLFTMLFIVGFSGHPVQATTWIISETSPTISQIVQIASAGDTLLLMHGTYYDQVFVDRPLTIASQYLFTHDSTDAISTIITIPDSIRIDSTRSRSPFEIRDVNAIRFVGITVENGLGTPHIFYGTTPMMAGGAIFSLNSNLTLQNCRIRTSSAQRGCGVLAYWGNIRIEDCRFEFCWYDGPCSGGGAYLKGDTIRVVRTLFNQNMLPRGSGGGLYFTAEYEGEISGCSFLQNTAGFTGGAGVLAGAKNIVNNRIIGNASTNNGAFTISSDVGEFNFLNNVVQDNRAMNFGYMSTPSHGAIFFQADELSQWNIYNNRFESNSSMSGQVLSNCGAVGFQGGSHILKQNSFIGNIGSAGAAITTTAVVTNLALDSNSFRSNHGTCTFFYLNSGTCTIQSTDFINNDGIAIDSRYYDTIPALNCYWGDPSGPRAPGNPNGLGDSINTFVLYEPFNTHPNMPENQTFISERPFIANPTSFGVLTAYPNPTNGAVTITFSLPAANQYTRIAVYDALGRKVANLWEGSAVTGEQRIQWHPQAIASGNYFLRAESSVGVGLTTRVQYLK